MSQHFGKTWWGKQWLNSLVNIDYGNRLPRGSSYAKKGAVQSLSIEENKVSALVAGSQPKPYQVTLVIPPFFEPEIKQLVKALAQKPLIISKLLNRELDPEVLSIAQSKGLKVFPEQWTDFKMQCNCPDWAVPCKHLASVIYKVAAEIDNNPFLAFSLHRVNLQAELAKENIHISAQTTDDIPGLSQLLNPISKPGSRKKNTSSTDSQLHQPNSPDLSALPHILEPLLQLLSPSPVFYQQKGDFRELYAANLRQLARKAHRVLQGKSSMASLFPLTTQKSNAGSLISHQSIPQIWIDDQYQMTLRFADQKDIRQLHLLITTLWAIPPSQISHFQPRLALLKNSLHIAFNLLAKGSIVPQIIQLPSGKFIIRWLPAMLSKAVRELIVPLEQAFTQNPVLFRKESNAPVAAPSSEILLSFWLNYLVNQLSSIDDGNIFSSVFFKQARYGFNSPGEKALPGGIHQWLQKYYLVQDIFKPALLVEELNNEQFGIELELKNNDQPNLPNQSLAIVLKDHAKKKHRYEILRRLSQLASFIPGLDQYINSEGNSPILIKQKDLPDFLFNAIPAIQLLDIDVLLPKTLQHIIKPKPSIKLKKKNQNAAGGLRLDALFDFDWQIAIGDTLMGEKDFMRMMKNAEGLVKYKAGYIYVSPADLEKIYNHFQSPGQLSPWQLLRTALCGEYNGAKISMTPEVEQMIQQWTREKEIPVPAGLQAELRPYQQRGFSWLYRNTSMGFGGIMADDMGLGKTLQVLATLLRYKEEGALKDQKALVIVPTGLLANWQAEIEKFAPSLKFKIHHGSSRTISKKDQFDLLITTYGIARIDAAKLKKMKWLAVVTDEAQNIKNPETGQAKAVKSIQASTFIAMSGTPVENRLTELWSIMDFCNRGFMGSIKEFTEEFAIPIQNQNNLAAAKRLKSITSPFILRRLKSDKSIISDLPDKLEMDCYASLAKEQAGLYAKTLENAMMEIEGIQVNNQKSLFVRQGLVLQMILALKQICNHPTQFLKNKVLDASLSGKMDLLLDKLESIIEGNEKVLIFTQFTEMGKLLEYFITQRFGEPPLFYHGGCTLKQRKEMINTFQHNRANQVFILSLKAAGTGLNLTAANHVIHYDLWWNPAVEAQATDRAYRIGQKNNVMVHRFITRATFEEKINAMIQQKKDLANLTVATGENWIGNLNNSELRNLFELQ